MSFRILSKTPRVREFDTEEEAINFIAHFSEFRASIDDLLVIGVDGEGNTFSMLDGVNLSDAIERGYEIW